MSIESLQFVEMVREAAANGQPGSPMDQSKIDHHVQAIGESMQLPSGTQPDRCIQLYEIRSYYCGVCGGERDHTLEKQGMDEVWRCCGCGIGKVFRIWMG